VDASREALQASPDWGAVALRLGWLAIFVAVSLVLALRAFGRYRRAI
jgi:hypothetical protein